MNPALMNYLQSQQMPQQQAAPQQQYSSQMQPQEMTGGNSMAQQTSSAPYNPFNMGIQNAIASARESLAMTDKQQNKALRSSLLAFGNQARQQPRVKGFWNNLGQVLEAAGPAVAAHDVEEQSALKENNALANQILAYQAAEEARQLQQQDRAANQEERLWHRKHAEAQLGEQRRSHNLMDNFRREKAGQERPLTKQEIMEHEKNLTKQDLLSAFDEAEQTIDATGNKGFRNRAERLADKFLPGGYRNNEEQATIDTLGDVIRGKLFNHWKYRNQTEFKHIPTISSENPPEVNKAILQKLKQLFAEGDNGPNEGNMMQNADMQSVLMQDGNGDQYEIPAHEVQGAMQDGLSIVR